MITFTLGLLLLAGGAAGRFPLVGSRVNSTVAAMGAIMSLLGLGGRLMSNRTGKQDEPQSAAPVSSVASNR